MGPKPENNKELLFAFQQELFGSLGMFVLFFPVCSYLGNSPLGWIYHFMGVMAFDVLTFGCSANPAVCLAMFLAGKFDLTSAVVRIVAELVAAFVAFPLLSIITPTWLMPNVLGPDLGAGVSIQKGFLVEAFLSYAFCFIVLVAVTWLDNPNLMRPLFATVLRVLLLIGGPLSGASFNPMIGTAWAWYKGRLFEGTYHYIYSLAPIIGAVVAAVAFSYISSITGVMTVAVTKVSKATVPASVQKDKVARRKSTTTTPVAKAPKEAKEATPKQVEKRGRSPGPAGAKSAPRSRSKTPTRPQSASRGRSASKDSSGSKQTRSIRKAKKFD